MKTVAFLAALAALAAPAAFAQQAEPAAPAADAPAVPATELGGDPNEMICRNQGTIGSRLSRRRVCATRQQWADQRRGDRNLTEKAQTNRTWCERGACH